MQMAWLENSINRLQSQWSQEFQVKNGKQWNMLTGINKIRHER